MSEDGTIDDAERPSDTERPSDADVRAAVRDRYGDVAAESDSCCGDSSCGDGEADPESQSRQVGYAQSDLDRAPEGANLGLGCGNPTALASLDAGETILDLGSGGGFDCFLAAEVVGSEGEVVGVDMTPEMVERARENAAESERDNVSFRLGEIEHLPVADRSVDVVVSNCVVNLSPDKPQVFAEAFRVLRPGGRLAISDVVRTTSFPPDIRTDPSSVSACVAGASTITEVESMLADAGFRDVSVTPENDSEEFIREWDEGDLSEYIVAATIEAKKPPR
jgi:SAM-dependent methyltransferase